jgi:hypothetical protein
MKSNHVIHQVRSRNRLDIKSNHVIHQVRSRNRTGNRGRIALRFRFLQNDADFYGSETLN